MIVPILNEQNKLKIALWLSIIFLFLTIDKTCYISKVMTIIGGTIHQLTRETEVYLVLSSKISPIGSIIQRLR